MNYVESLKDNDNVYIIELEKELYSKSTILKSCYKFSDVAYLFLESEKINGIDIYKIYFNLKNGNIDFDIKGSFMNELLDQELRSIVLEETKTVRDTIVTRALLSGQANDN